MDISTSKTQITQFFTSQYLYAGIRIALAIVIPSLILAHFGVLKEYFIFPLGTSFIGLTDMAGPYHRRRNALALACVLFAFIALVAGLASGYPILIFAQIVFWGIFLSMIGVYGIRLAAVGGLGLVVLAIFIDGQFTSSGNILKTVGILFLGCLWYLLVFMSVSRLQPYKLAQQMIGENYFQLAEYLKIKAKFYDNSQSFDALQKEVIAQQVIIKNLQEETREVVFKTRKIVNESTTTSRLLMLNFLNSIDFYEKLFTTDHDYKTLHAFFHDDGIMQDIERYLQEMAKVLSLLGVSIQSGFSQTKKIDLNTSFERLTARLRALETKRKNAENQQFFQKIWHIIERIDDATKDVLMIQKFQNQDGRSARALSTGLDYSKFVPRTEKLNHKVLFSNFSLQSFHFRYAIRMTIALLLGYGISLFPSLDIGYPYWILITIVAIMRPAFSTTKGRNLLRIYGTIGGAVASYGLLYFVSSPMVLLIVLLFSMILCFSFLKDNYAWAVFFMTIYIFITFNFMLPGNINTLFKDRLVDTFIAGVIVFLVSYSVLPVWEHTMSVNLMRRSLVANQQYFETVMKKLTQNVVITQDYKLKRKEAIISLANLSDSFQRMLSDPKNQQKKMEYLHQYVNTTHLITAYIASLSQYEWNEKWALDTELQKMAREIERDFSVVHGLLHQSREVISDEVSLEPIVQGNMESEEFKNIRDIIFLLKEVVAEQRKLVERNMQKA